MQLPLQDFGTLVKTQSAAVGASCKQLTDMTVGSVLRAILEANASVALWIQWLILQVLAMTRAATSTGGDLDSWVADYGMARLPPSAARGYVQLGRATAGLATTIPVGASVRTGTTSADQMFQIIADPSNARWNGSGYTVDAASLSVSVPVAAVLAGGAGNVRAAAVTQLASAIPGIDTVTNPLPMSGGVDSETDTALRSRFSDFLDSRTRATAQAVGFAIMSVRQGLSYTIAERVDASGAERAGHFTVTLDDGSGSPSAELVGQVAAAIEAVRPLGGTFSVRAPAIAPVTIAATIVGTSVAAAAAQAAIAAFVSSLPIGAPLLVSRLYQIAHDADPGVTSVTTVNVNGAQANINPPIFGLIRPASVVVTLA